MASKKAGCLTRELSAPRRIERFFGGEGGWEEEEISGLRTAEGGG